MRRTPYREHWTTLRTGTSFPSVHMVLAVFPVFLVQAKLLALSRVVEWAVAGFGVVVAVGFAFGLALTIILKWLYVLKNLLKHHMAITRVIPILLLTSGLFDTLHPLKP
ncbi:hypothetical protein QNH36_22700 [Mesobacillus sp. AQ2]|uniref:hypothetical protein n=1 Tax=Mesobacillus sp. AQ2 TaxID=3043332 RepID=UPI0024C19BEC|nr:hypothetical protein [Mesobacillus sp. AQ2]WHX40417.1 hypothetical protein QNH36_22700 [Mesobacillus sp. AQ2]